jgi:hypothetical protein
VAVRGWSAVCWDWRVLVHGQLVVGGRLSVVCRRWLMVVRRSWVVVVELCVVGEGDRVAVVFILVWEVVVSLVVLSVVLVVAVMAAVHALRHCTARLLRPPRRRAIPLATLISASGCTIRRPLCTSGEH